MKYKTLLFDFDYTLADSSKGIYMCIEYALSRLGETIPDYHSACQTIGLSLPETYVSLTGNTNPERSERFRLWFIEKADEVMVSQTELFGYVSDTMERLKRMGLNLVIISTKYRRRIIEILSRFNQNNLFDLIVGGEDVAVNKPDPEGVIHALGCLGNRPEECLFIGDSIVDAQTAKNASVPFVAVLTGTTQKEAFKSFAPSRILNSVKELPDYLKNS